MAHEEEERFVLAGREVSLLDYAPTRCTSTAQSLCEALGTYHEIRLRDAAEILSRPTHGDAILCQCTESKASGFGHSWMLRYERDTWYVYHSFIGQFPLRRQTVHVELMIRALEKSNVDATALWRILCIEDQFRPSRPLGWVSFHTNIRKYDVGLERIKRAAIWRHGSSWSFSAHPLVWACLVVAPLLWALYLLGIKSATC